MSTHTRPPRPSDPCVTASINAGDVNIWVFARSCDQSTLFIHPCCCRPSGGVITRGRTKRTRTGALAFRLASKSEWARRVRVCVCACVCVGGRGRFMATFMSLPNYRIAVFVCFCLAQISLSFQRNVARLQNRRTCRTVTRPDVSAPLIGAFSGMFCYSPRVSLYMLHTEPRNIHFSGKVGPFCLGSISLKDLFHG